MTLDALSIAVALFGVFIVILSFFLYKTTVYYRSAASLNRAFADLTHGVEELITLARRGVEQEIAEHRAHAAFLPPGFIVASADAGVRARAARAANRAAARAA